MEQPILFSHIPKTGGTTLRIILNKVYGHNNVYFIKSTNPAESLLSFKQKATAEKNQFDVISGHGADYFGQYINNPFRITILRDPAELFISQYYYLKKSPNSTFKKEVSEFSSIETYIDFALENGQDNLLTRYLSKSVDWLFNHELEIPDLNKEGALLLERAKENLLNYDAVLNLKTFDSGIFKLKELLYWTSIPLYRPANRTKSGSKNPLPKNLNIKLENLLRFDMELFQFFLDHKLDVAHNMDKRKMPFKLFNLRQEIINKIF